MRRGGARDASRRNGGGARGVAGRSGSRARFAAVGGAIVSAKGPASTRDTPSGLRALFAHGLRERRVHIDRKDRDAVALRVSSDDRRRVEAHRLVVEERDVELGRVVELEMRGVIRGERERGRVALAESEFGERGDLPEDLVRGHVVNALGARAVHERTAQALHVGRATSAAHRAAEHVSGRGREPRGGNGHPKDLLLEEDHAERLFEDRLEKRMRILDRLASLTAANVRIDHVPLEWTGPDDRNLDHDVREVARADARQRLRLRAALHLEESDRVDLADEVIARGIVERQGTQLEQLPVARVDVRDRVLHKRERAQAEQIHLDKAEVLDVALVELHDVAVRHRRTLDRHGVDERQRGNEHPAVVDRQMSREVGDGKGELAKKREAFALLVVEDLEQVLERVRQRARALPAMLSFAVRMLVRRMLRGARIRPRIDVVLIDRLRHPVDRLRPEAERLRHLPAGGARAVRDDVADHRRVAIAVLFVDVLDDLLAIVRRDVEVDVRHRPRVLGEEALEEEVVLDRVDLGDVEDIGDDRVRGRSPALRRDPVLLAEADDVPVDEEELRATAAGDDVELVGELRRDVARDAWVPDLRALATERVQKGERGVPFGDRKTWKAIFSDERGFGAWHVRVVEKVEHARVGDRARVAERLVEAPQALPEHDLALEPVLAVGLQLVPDLVERDAEIDAAKHVVKAAALGARVVDVVRDHAAQAHLPSKRREGVAERGAVGIEVVRELDIEALAEYR